MVSESVNDFLNHDEPVEDIIDAEDLEGIEDIENADLPEEELEVEDMSDELAQSFRAELSIPEFNRLSFFIKLQSGEEFEAVPMAEMSGSKAFLFKIGDQIKKINLSNIVDSQEIIGDEFEEEEVNENFDDEEEGCPYCGSRHCDGNCEDDDE